MWAPVGDVMARPDPDLMAGLARQLAAEDSLDRLWRRVVDASVSQIDGAEHAGITVLTRKSVSTPVASDHLVREIDERQYAVAEGPCLTAALQHEPVVRVADLHSDQRWPKFSAAIAHLDVRSMLSFQLYTGTGTDDGTIGALNIYAGPTDAFTDESVHTGSLLAAHAAVAAAANAETGGLRIALESRDAIGQAKGILMERYKITSQQAFDLLIAASQNTHRKLRDVAERLAATGELTADD